MVNKKIIKFNLISIVFLLIYMALHLSVSGHAIINAQGSGGLSGAWFDFNGLHIIDIHGTETGSLLSPSIVMVVLLFLVLLINGSYI